MYSSFHHLRDFNEQSSNTPEKSIFFSSSSSSRSICKQKIIRTYSSKLSSIPNESKLLNKISQLDIAHRETGRQILQLMRNRLTTASTQP